MPPTIAIGIDLGGTNLKLGAVDAGGAIIAKRQQPIDLSRGPDPVLETMIAMVRSLASGVSSTHAEVAGVGIGAPGPLSPSRGMIFHSVNLPGWRNVAIVDRLAQALSLPITLDNDGNAAAFGEHWGASAGCHGDDLVMLTLGTGIGAGVVIDGRLLHGQQENAAELGHIIVVAGGLPCPCGQCGCVEQYASARAIASRTMDAIRSGEPSSLLIKTKPGEPIDARHITDAARAGDPLALRIFDEACHYLAILCVNIQHTYNPARIVFGGGLSEAGEFLLDRIRKQYETLRWSLHDDYPTLALAQLGYDAGIVGAAGLAWQQYESQGR